MPSNTGLQQRAAGSPEGAAPLHVAIIMDGNGRWAKRRGLPRTLGHREGVKALKRTVVAFNYGGRADIVDAARRFAQAVERGEASPDDLDEDRFEADLSTAPSPPPDLIVRTSGEHRISNFLLWESAYAELVFQEVLWPDYGPEHLKAAIAEFRSRDRRYGGVAADDVLAAG